MPIRAALLTPSFAMGGAERWLISLALHTNPEKIEWTGLAISGWGGADYRLCCEMQRLMPLHGEAPHGTKPHEAGSLATYWPSLIEAAHEVCRGADVLVTWGSSNLAALSQECAVPIVLVWHSSIPVKPISCPVHRVAVSKPAARALSEEGAHEVTIIRNGADVERCAPRYGRRAQRKEWGFEDEIVVGYLGRHSEEKNPQAAILAVERLGPPYAAVYYGWGRRCSTSGVSEDARRLGRDRVRVYEPVQHVGDVLAGLDVFMLASKREACSLGLLEAFLAGVPVVATPVGAVPELEEEFGNLTVQVGVDANADELAEAVRIAASPQGRQLAQRAQRLAWECWTAGAMAAQWETYLTDVVLRSRR